MIIPIRCFTCNKEISTCYQAYLEQIQTLQNKEIIRLDANLLNSGKIEKSEHGKILDELGLKLYCCRRHILGQVDVIDII